MDVVLELALRGPKGVAHGDVGVCVRRVLGWRTAHDDAMARDTQLDQDAIETALVVPVRSFDRDTAADDPVEQLLEIVDPLADVGVQSVASGQLMKRDLRG
jgi:hypothetical protein